MIFETRVYYEDTDAGGIVYYANYLKFAERARTEVLRALGFEQRQLRDTHGVLFVVRRVTVDYRRPARLDDWITVETQLRGMTKMRMSMRQCIARAQETLADIEVELVAVNAAGRPVEIPRALAQVLEREMVK